MSSSLRASFLHILRKNGIQRGSKSLSDYEQGKKLIPECTSKDYAKYIKWLSEYVGLEGGK